MARIPPSSSNSSPRRGAVDSFYAALADIGDLVAEMPHPQILYERVVQILERHVGALMVLAGEIDYDAGLFRRRAPVPPPAELADIYPDAVPLSLARPLFWEGRIEVEANIAHAPGREALRPAYERHHIRASAAVPVLCFGAVHSALIVRSSDPAFFAPEMLQLLERAAVSMGHALEGDMQRTRLRQALADADRGQRAMRLLSETLKAATHAVDEDELLQAACRAVVGTGLYPVCWAGLLDSESGQVLTLRAHAGHGQAVYDNLSIRPFDSTADGTVTAHVVRHHTPCIKHPDEGGDAAWAQRGRELGLGAVLGLPLQHGQHVTGVMVIGGSNRGDFSSAELDIFRELAGELSLGMERLRIRRGLDAAERQRRINLRRFEAMLASGYAGILALDSRDRVEFVNQSFCRLFDLDATPADLIGLSSSDLLERVSDVYAHPEREAERVERIIARGEPVESEEVAMARGRTYLRSFTPIVIDGQVHGRVWHTIDITERKSQEAEVERLAFYDPVTELPNRRLFGELLERSCGQARRQQVPIAVGVMDLDGFKHINDHLGHAAGDAVLGEVAARITAALREGDVVARLGGDEFALILHDAQERADVHVVSRRILGTLREPLGWHGELLRLSASIGWTLYPRDNVDPEALMRHADLAMYRAKEQGRDRDAFFSAALERDDLAQRSMKSRVAAAIEAHELQLHFQPIVAIDGDGGHRVIAAEALLRMRDDDGRLLGPVHFHQALDDPRLARPIGCYVLDHALATSEVWLGMDVHLPVSVNISTRHLMHPEFIADLDRALAAHPDVTPADLGIEVTETGPLLDRARARLLIDACRQRGIHVSLDDFGTGSASLSHIQQMDVATLKIDQSFVRDILVEPRNIAIAAGIITTSRMLGLDVTAEGVETREQAKLLVELGCRQLQGYLISRPMPAADVPSWLASWPGLGD